MKTKAREKGIMSSFEGDEWQGKVIKFIVAFV